MSNNKHYKIILLGPQGSGKGTQAQLLSLHLGIPTVSMGDLIRDEIKSGGVRAKIISEITNSGKLIPHEITIELLKEWLEKDKQRSSFIIDGFPRTIEQLFLMDKILKPTHVFVLEMSDHLAVERLAGRLICECGMIYHKKWNPPKNDNICDKCGAKLVRRDDDTQEAIKERLKIYHTETSSAIREFDRREILHRIDAAPTIPVVHGAILKELGIEL